MPALLMSMVHMTGDLTLLDELPGPFMLIAMDLQGGMSEPTSASSGTGRSRWCATTATGAARRRCCPHPTRSAACST